jgi:hypothetical protein
MPKIIEFKDAADLVKLRKRVKQGELEELKGAYDEPVFISKTKGDMSLVQREAMEEWRRKKSQELIERVKKLKTTKTA